MKSKKKRKRNTKFSNPESTKPRSMLFQERMDEMSHKQHNLILINQGPFRLVAVRV